jgi:hypothetical protein
MWMVRALLPALLCVALAPPATADEQAPAGDALAAPLPADQLRDMDSDRPNKTDTPHTIDAGHVQAEMGLVDYVYDRQRSGGVDTRSDAFGLGLVNLRLGLLDDLEINALISPYEREQDEDYRTRQSSRAEGDGDLVVGGKLNLWGDDGGDDPWSTALAIKPQFKLPTAGRGLGNGHTEIFVEFPLLVNLPDGFHLGAQTVVSRERDTANAAYVTGWQNSVSIDRTVIGDADMYLEYWTEVTTERSRKAAQTLDVGLTYPLTDNLLIDAGANFGLNQASDTLEWLAGLSLRF